MNDVDRADDLRSQTQRAAELFLFAPVSADDGDRAAEERERTERLTRIDLRGRPFVMLVVPVVLILRHSETRDERQESQRHYGCLCLVHVGFTFGRPVPV